MRRMQRGRPDGKLVTGRSNGDAYATVYATGKGDTLAELSKQSDHPRHTPTRSTAGSQRHVKKATCTVLRPTAGAGQNIHAIERVDLASIDGR